MQASDIRRFLPSNPGSRVSYEIYIFVNSSKTVSKDFLRDLEIHELEWMSYQFLELVISRGAEIDVPILEKLVAVKSIDADTLLKYAIILDAEPLIMDCAKRMSRSDLVSLLEMKRLARKLPA